MTSFQPNPVSFYTMCTIVAAGIEYVCVKQYRPAVDKYWARRGDSECIHSFSQSQS